MVLGAWGRGSVCVLVALLLCVVDDVVVIVVGG